MKKLIFVRHGDSGRSDSLTDEGVNRVRKLREQLGFKTETGGCPSPKSLVFCSEWVRSFQTARELRPRDCEVIALGGLCGMDDKFNDHVSKLLEKIMNLCVHMNYGVATVVCHGAYPTILAELASERVAGKSIRNTLELRTVPYASGYSVDMHTGEVTFIAQPQ